MPIGGLVTPTFIGELDIPMLIGGLETSMPPAPQFLVRSLRGDDSAESGGEYGSSGITASCGEGVGREGGVGGESFSSEDPKGLAKAVTSRLPPGEETLEEKESYFFLCCSPSSPLLMANMRSSSSSTLHNKKRKGLKG